MLMVCSHINPKFSCCFKRQEGKGGQELNLVFLQKKKVLLFIQLCQVLVAAHGSFS